MLGKNKNIQEIELENIKNICTDNAIKLVENLDDYNLECLGALYKAEKEKRKRIRELRL